MKILTVSKTLKIFFRLLTSSELLIVIYSFFFLINLSKKLINVPSTFLSELNFFLNSANTKCDAFFFMKSEICQVISLISYIIFLIPYDSSYLYQIFLTSQNAMHLVYFLSVFADISLLLCLLER